MTIDDPIWDELFHACAFEAFVTVAREQQGWPSSEAVRKLAHRTYEEELRRKDAKGEESC